jgi:hypothetical protein
VLSKELKRDCQYSPAGDDFRNAGLEVGELAVDLTLRDIGGTEYDLSRLLVEKPVAIVFGSFT